MVRLLRFVCDFIISLLLPHMPTAFIRKCASVTTNVNHKQKAVDTYSKNMYTLNSKPFTFLVYNYYNKKQKKR